MEWEAGDNAGAEVVQIEAEAPLMRSQIKHQQRVLMLGNMGDPKSIGPAMAVALLTTLYGAFVANVLFAPIVRKLEYYTSYEVVYREIVLEGLRGIARSESPRNIQDQMAAALPPKLQSKFELAA